MRLIGKQPRLIVPLFFRFNSGLVRLIVTDTDINRVVTLLFQFRFGAIDSTLTDKVFAINKSFNSGLVRLIEIHR